MFEIRDRGTCISAMAVRLGSRNEAERFILSRAGFGMTVKEQACYFVLHHLGEQKANYDPFAWTAGRTMGAAHHHIEQHWQALESGAVVDVEFILGERATPKVSEAVGSAC